MGKDGTVVYESGATFETALAEAGFWPDKRAGKKGVEPESVTVGTFDGTRYIFVGAERADAVGVYDATDLSNPILKQNSSIWYCSRRIESNPIKKLVRHL